MKRSRWLAVAAAMAVVVLIAPATGAGKGAAGALAWSRGGITTSSSVFSTAASGSHGSRSFKLTNWGRHASGRFAIHLTGSPAFSIASTGCALKLGARKSCRVTVDYAPSEAGARDHAVLTATRQHARAVSLDISGCSVDASGPVYWVTNNYQSGSVKEGLFAADCPTTIITLASGEHDPRSLAVDDTHVYWTNWNDGTVKSVPIGGGAVTTLASGQSTPWSVAVDSTHVYWRNAFNSVNAVPVGGGSVTTVVTEQDGVNSFAVDGTNVYWTTGGSVKEVPVGGGAVTTLATGQNYPFSVAVDGTHVYWANFFGTKVNAVPVGGGAVTTLASGQDRPESVAVDGTHVYWITGHDAVKAVPIGGGSVTTLVSGEYNLISFAVAGTHVYWGADAWTYPNYPQGAVKEVPVGGGPVNTVARGQSHPEWVGVGH